MPRLLDWLPFRFKRSTDRGATPVPVHQRARSSPERAPRIFDLADHRVARDPFGTAFGLLRYMDELMEQAFDHDRFFGDFSTPFWPRLDVSEDASDLKVVVELPGLSRDDFRVELHDGALVISGEKRYESEHREDGFYRTERGFGAFRRVVPLPSNVDLDTVDARHDRGLLTIRIRKLDGPASGPRLIPVRAA